MIYGLLGEKLEHSFSPRVHGLLGQENYQLFEVEKEGLEEFIRAKEYDGLNVTMPYKKAVIPFLDELTDTAREIGSVNLILKREDDTLLGDNTDCFGFVSLVKKSRLFVGGKKVLVLGSGGASPAVCAGLRRLHAGEIVVISRSGENNYENISKHADADFIVNTTPVGMYPDNDSTPLSLDGFTKLSGVFDIIYNPVKTRLVLEAEERGIPAVGGIHMLIMQAVLTEEKIQNTFIHKSVFLKAEDLLLKSVKNITLIGMPGSGKTVVGRRLAARLGREFVDIDHYIEAREGRTVTEIFTEDGEENFRRIETECTAEVCKRSGLVISTGGGVVVKDRNKNILKQNSTVVYLICNNPNASKRKRPILNEHSYEELAQERIPRYKAWADTSILNTGINETVTSLAWILKVPYIRKNDDRSENNEEV